MEQGVKNLEKEISLLPEIKLLLLLELSRFNQNGEIFQNGVTLVNKKDGDRWGGGVAAAGRRPEKETGDNMEVVIGNVDIDVLIKLYSGIARLDLQDIAVNF